VTLCDLPAGTMLSAEMLTVKRPGTGIPAAELERMVGKSLTRDVSANGVLHWADIGEAPPGAEPAA
jgi:sialic acid synthase SpsE